MSAEDYAEVSREVLLRAVRNMAGMLAAAHGAPELAETCIKVALVQAAEEVDAERRLMAEVLERLESL